MMPIDHDRLRNPAQGQCDGATFNLARRFENDRLRGTSSRRETEKIITTTHNSMTLINHHHHPERREATNSLAMSIYLQPYSTPCASAASQQPQQLRPDHMSQWSTSVAASGHWSNNQGFNQSSQDTSCTQQKQQTNDHPLYDDQQNNFTAISATGYCANRMPEDHQKAEETSVHQQYLDTVQAGHNLTAYNPVVADQTYASYNGEAQGLHQQHHQAQSDLRDDRYRHPLAMAPTTNYHDPNYSTSFDHHASCVANDPTPTLYQHYHQNFALSAARANRANVYNTETDVRFQQPADDLCAGHYQYYNNGYERPAPSHQSHDVNHYVNYDYSYTMETCQQQPLPPPPPPPPPPLVSAQPDQSYAREGSDLSHLNRSAQDRTNSMIANYTDIVQTKPDTRPNAQVSEIEAVPDKAKNDSVVGRVKTSAKSKNHHHHHHHHHHNQQQQQTPGRRSSGNHQSLGGKLDENKPSTISDDDSFVTNRQHCTSEQAQFASAMGACDRLNRLNQCRICGRNYARPSTLKTHLRTHTNERPYKCSACFKTFSQAANLTAHQRVHTGERPFPCPICGRQFSQSSSVITHLRTHSGERPYRCNMCSRTFSDSSTLTKHCRVHSGEKPYQCDYCPMNFSQSGNLSRHLRLHSITGGNSITANKTLVTTSASMIGMANGNVVVAASGGVACKAGEQRIGPSSNSPPSPESTLSSYSMSSRLSSNASNSTTSVSSSS